MEGPTIFFVRLFPRVELGQNLKDFVLNDQPKEHWS